MNFLQALFILFVWLNYNVVYISLKNKSNQENFRAKPTLIFGVHINPGNLPLKTFRSGQIPRCKIMLWFLYIHFRLRCLYFLFFVLVIILLLNWSNNVCINFEICLYWYFNNTFERENKPTKNSKEPKMIWGPSLINFAVHFAFYCSTFILSTSHYISYVQISSISIVITISSTAFLLFILIYGLHVKNLQIILSLIWLNSLCLL